MIDKPGTALRAVIHAAIDLAPAPAALKRRCKSCAGCYRRANWLDAAPKKIAAKILGR